VAADSIRQAHQFLIALNQKSNIPRPTDTIGYCVLPTRQRDPSREEGSFKYIDIASINRETKQIEQASEVACDMAPSRARKQVRAGDVIVSTVRPNLNAVAQVPTELDGQIASTGFAVLRPNQERIHPRYLYYRVITDEFINDMVSQAKGAGYPAVSDRIILDHKLPLPPLPEQHRIVEILDQADTLRQQRRQAEALSQRILPALFHEMFGDSRSNPHTWPIDTLQNLARVVTGSTPSSKLEGMFDGPVPFVTPADLKETWVNHIRSVTKEGAAQSRTVRAGSALVCCIGATIGKMGKASEESAFNQQINAVEWFDNSFDSYGLEALKQIKDQIISGASSTTLPIMNKSTFQALQIPHPPKALREKFAELVAGLEAAASNQTTSAATLETLFQTLLHRAFDGSLTAKWREGHGKELLQEMKRQSL
jgi:type I restriction enzyme, S subunit